MGGEVRPAKWLMCLFLHFPTAEILRYAQDDREAFASLARRPLLSTERSFAALRMTRLVAALRACLEGNEGMRGVVASLLRRSLLRAQRSFAALRMTVSTPLKSAQGLIIL